MGLIRSERIDRLALRRSDEAHSQALRRLELLIAQQEGVPPAAIAQLGLPAAPPPS